MPQVGPIFVRMNAQAGPATYPALTGIRTLAISMVFAHHHGPQVPMLQYPVVQALVGQMHTGVVLFFVLSGFLITDRYFATARPDLRNYVMRRIGRVLPLYAVLTTLTFSVFAFESSGSDPGLLLQYLANITLLRGWFEDLWATGILQGWSLTVEMTFYLLAPVIFMLISWRGMLVWIIPLVLIGIGVLLVEVCNGSAPLGFMDSYPFLFGITFPGRCIEFFVGIALALLHRRFRAARTNSYATLTGAIICLVVIGTGAMFGVDYHDPGGVLLHNVLLPIGIGVFFWGLLKEKTTAQDLLAFPVMVFMGRTSYAFYLIHMGVVFNAVYAVANGLVLSFILLQILAWVLYRTIEEPCVRFTKRRFPMVLAGHGKGHATAPYR